MKSMHKVCFQKISIPTPIEEGLLENPREGGICKGQKVKRKVLEPCKERERERGVQVQTIEPPRERYGYFLEQRNQNTYSYFRERIRIIGKVANYFNWNI